jgi:hypothetical protein
LLPRYCSPLCALHCAMNCIMDFGYVSFFHRAASSQLAVVILLYTCYTIANSTPLTANWVWWICAALELLLWRATRV